MIWLVQKQNVYGQKAEPICNLAGTEGKVVRTERRLFYDLVGTEAKLLRTKSGTNL